MFSPCFCLFLLLFRFPGRFAVPFRKIRRCLLSVYPGNFYTPGILSLQLLQMKQEAAQDILQYNQESFCAPRLDEKAGLILETAQRLNQ